MFLFNFFQILSHCEVGYIYRWELVRSLLQQPQRPNDSQALVAVTLTRWRNGMEEEEEGGGGGGGGGGEQDARPDK